MINRTLSLLVSFRCYSLHPSLIRPCRTQTHTYFSRLSLHLVCYLCYRCNKLSSESTLHQWSTYKHMWHIRTPQNSFSHLQFIIDVKSSVFSCITVWVYAMCCKIIQFWASVYLQIAILFWRLICSLWSCAKAQHVKFWHVLFLPCEVVHFI